MAATDELFMLIKSMDKSEKGYFRKFSKLHGSTREGNYLKLFDSMASMEDYSDKKLRDMFRGESFLLQLGATKFYLKKMLIRALRNYHEDRVPQLQAVLSIADAQVMQHKKMNDGLPARFEKELAAALSSEKYNEYMVWSTMYYNWLGIYGYPKKFEGVRKKIVLERAEVIKKQQNYNDYLILSNEAERLEMLSGSLPAAGIINEMQTLLLHPLLASPTMALSNSAENFRNAVLTQLYQNTGQFDKVLTLLRGQIEKISKGYNGANPPALHFLAILGRAIGLLTKKDVDEMQELIKKFEQILFTYKNTITQTSWWHCEFGLLVYKSNYHFYKREPEAQLVIIEKMKERLKAHPQLVQQHEIVALTAEALALVELRLLDKALEVVNTMYNENYKMRNDLVLLAARLSIIIHIEFGNFRLVETLIDRAAKMSRQTEHELPYQKELYNYLKLMAEKIEHKKASEIKAAAKSFLQFIEAKAPHRVDYITHWLEDIVKDT